MAGMTPFTIEAEVSCTDGFCGTLSRLVVDRRGRTVTHRVVNDRQLQGRLVPVDLVDVDAATGKIRLRCPTAEFQRLDAANGEDRRAAILGCGSPQYGESAMDRSGRARCVPDKPEIAG